jgi:hypothetical protein
MKTKTNREITDETIALAFQWVNDKITLADVARKLDTVNMTHAYTTLARALKDHLKK